MPGHFSPPSSFSFPVALYVVTSSIANAKCAMGKKDSHLANEMVQIVECGYFGYAQRKENK